MACWLRSILRTLRFLGVLLRGGLGLLLDRPKTHAEGAEWLHRICARSLRKMGVRVRAEGRLPASGVVISNHLGYLDIVTCAALGRCVFVSKSEIADWPVIGWMTRMAGTVFVERGRGRSAALAAQGMQAAAAEGLPVVFFPEGRTSSGESVLAFHSGLLAKALEAGQPVTAAFVRYRLTADNGPGVTVARDLAYWGDVTFAPHVFRLLGLKGIEVEMRFVSEPICFSAAALANRRIAAEEARAAVMQLGGIAELTAAK